MSRKEVGMTGKCYGKKKWNTMMKS